VSKLWVQALGNCIHLLSVRHAKVRWKFWSSDHFIPTSRVKCLGRTVMQHSIWPLLSSPGVMPKVTLFYLPAWHTCSFIHSSMALQPFDGPWPLLRFCNLFTQTAGLGRRTSPSQGRYLHTGQHPHTDIHALSGIRTNEPTIRANECSSCLRPCCHYDRPLHTCYLHLFTLLPRHLRLNVTDVPYRQWKKRHKPGPKQLMHQKLYCHCDFSQRKISLRKIKLVTI
jgi:hypothetical protein